MTSKAILFVLGITEEFGTDVFQLVLVLWFFSVGYLLCKRANRSLTERRLKAALDAPEVEVPCLMAESYRTTAM